ncbi:MAG TPA: hypothetical protein VF613_10690 [Longimicrobium sp.]|jgi:hypothetical protein
MMIDTQRATLGALLLLLAACGGGGGELREATERRRAETSGADTTTGLAATDTGEFRAPAFVDTTPAAPAAAVAPADTTPAPAAQPGNPPGQPEWSASTRQGGREGGGTSTLREMRVGNNAGFDRLVLDFGDDPVPPYQVEYVDSPVRACGSGDPVAVAGQGFLVVRMRSAQAHDGAGRATIQQRQIVPRTPVLREVEIICDFEAQVEIVMGVQSPNPYRVLVVPSPNRLIVDVRQ